MPKFKIHSFAVAAASLACLISIPPSTASDVPDSIAAHGEVFVAAVHATGAQIYECKTDASGKLAWQFREPIAALFADGKTVGRHYAGPHWEMTDGSAVSAKVSARAPGASGNDIPLLKLEVTSWRGRGQLAGVTTIQRINTNGGVASGACDSAGDILSVPYSADYNFLRKSAAGAGVSAPVVSRAVPAAAPAYVASPVVVAPRPAIGVIIVRGDDRDRRPRKKKGEPKSPTGEPKSPPSKQPPTAEPKSPPIVPNRTVRDHRGTNGGGGSTVTPTRPYYDGAEKAEGRGASEKRQSKIRDHRGVDAASRDGASEKRQPKIRDHRGSATASNDKPGGGTSSGGKPPSGPRPGSGSKPICGFSGTPPCLPQ
jgi:hypothetical protein